MQVVGRGMVPVFTELWEWDSDSSGAVCEVHGGGEGGGVGHWWVRLQHKARGQEDLQPAAVLCRVDRRTLDWGENWTTIINVNLPIYSLGDIIRLRVTKIEKLSPPPIPSVSITVWSMGSDKKCGLSWDGDGTWGWPHPLWQRYQEALHNTAMCSAVQPVLLGHFKMEKGK